MNFGGHLMSGWVLAHLFKLPRPAERRLVTVMAIAPDLDGVFLIYPPLFGYFHRTFGHNVWFWLLVPLLSALLFLPRQRRWRLYPVLVLSISVHFLTDLLATGWWELRPLYPFSSWAIFMDRYIPEHIMKYYIQLGLFVVLLVPTVYILWCKGRTPLETLSGELDRLIVDFIRLPWRTRCSYCHRRAFYRCGKCGKALCGIHRRFILPWYPSCRTH